MLVVFWYCDMSSEIFCPYTEVENMACVCCWISYLISCGQQVNMAVYHSRNGFIWLVKII